MAPSSSPSPSPSVASLSPPSYQSPYNYFSPIQERCEGEEHEKEGDEGSRHQPTPTPESTKTQKNKTLSGKKPPESVTVDAPAVSCNKCRPSARDKISVAPLEHGGLGRRSLSMASPNGIFRSIVASLTKRSPKPPDSPSPAALATEREERWTMAVEEISNKLVHATRKRDEAVLEASRLKSSVTDLENKLVRLESYCDNLKSGIDNMSQARPIRVKAVDRDAVLRNFLVAVSESRSAVRQLSRSLTGQLRRMEARVHERLASLLQPYDVKLTKNPKAAVFYLEAVLSRVFFEDFESTGFCKNSTNRVLNPIEQCRSNYESFAGLKALTWDEVLIKGTRFFDEDFSGFCDRKMSDVVAVLGWSRAWPEPLLRAFFGASKWVWLLHLLATSVHPGLPVFRVENGVGFDPVYMEDMGGDSVRGLVPTAVRAMVSPGFYVYGSVVKCKVICRYNGCNVVGGDHRGLALTPSPN